MAKHSRRTLSMRSEAGVTLPLEFNDRVLDLKSAFVGCCPETSQGVTFVKFLDIATVSADREYGCPVAMLRIDTGNIGVDCFKSVRGSLLDQFVEGAINSWRRGNFMHARGIENFIGRHRPCGRLQDTQDTLMIGRLDRRAFHRDLPDSSSDDCC